MSNARLQVVRLDAAHDRAAFHCDSEPLNRYLREQVTQDIRRHVTFCFVALVEGNRIAGYYTLASASFLMTDLPVSISKKLPRYPTVPAVRMGKTLLIGQRKPDDFGLLEGSLCGFLDSGHNEIGHCTSLKFSNALEHRM